MDPVLARKYGWSVAVPVVTIKGAGLFSTLCTQDNKCFRHKRKEASGCDLLLFLTIDD